MNEPGSQVPEILPQDFLLCEIVSFPYCFYIADYKLVAVLSRTLQEVDIQISISR